MSANHKFLPSWRFNSSIALSFSKFRSDFQNNFPGKVTLRPIRLQIGNKVNSLFQVAWLRVDTQTILTIHSHVITKNHRIGVTRSDHRTWYLHIRDVRESDRGWYMCQINTDPMKSQTGFLEVVGKYNHTMTVVIVNIKPRILL